MFVRDMSTKDGHAPQSSLLIDYLSPYLHFPTEILQLTRKKQTYLLRVTKVTFL